MALKYCFSGACTYCYMRVDGMVRSTRELPLHNHQWLFSKRRASSGGASDELPALGCAFMGVHEEVTLTLFCASTRGRRDKRVPQGDRLRIAGSFAGGYVMNPQSGGLPGYSSALTVRVKILRNVCHYWGCCFFQVFQAASDP